MTENYILEKKTFKELKELKNLLDGYLHLIPGSNITSKSITKYVETFDINIRKALNDSTCSTSMIPYGGTITMNSNLLSKLFKIMPDLYEYMKIQYSAVESQTDMIINNILDDAFNEKQIIYSYYYETYFAYIVEDYYYSYLPGYLPCPFSIDNLQLFSKDDNKSLDKYKCSFPRKLYWWKDVNFYYS